MQQSFLSGKVVERSTVETIADGIAVRVPVPDAVQDMRGLVDEVVLVTDDAILRAMRLLYRETGLLVEPSGAAGIAAVLSGDFAGQRLATVLCGGNLTDGQVRNWILPNGAKQD
jgi:threonine dehydratase